MNAGQLRVAVVGTGAIAQIVHLPLLNDMPGVRVQAVCDADDAKARAIAGRMDIPQVFRTDEEAFTSDDIDAVVICSPSHLHGEQVVAALEAGKHVLVERPLALDPKGAAAAVEAGERAGRTLMIAFNNRYRPDVQGVRGFVASGELGEMFAIKGAWFNRKVRPKRLTWRHHKETAGGGAFMDLGVQVLDLCLWMLGYPDVDRVCAHMHPGENMPVEDAAAVLLRLKNGATLSVDVTWSSLEDKDRHYVRMFGTAGSASVMPLRVFKEVEHGVLDVTPQVPPGRENPYTASYREELRNFIAAALGDGAAPPREQIELMRLVRHIYESAEKGKEVRL